MATQKFSAFISYLEGQIKYNETSICTISKQLDENFTHYLPWNLEERYKLGVRVEELKKLLSYARCVEATASPDDMPSEFLRHQIDSYNEFLSMPSNVVGSSSNHINNLCVTWKYKVILELKNTLEERLK